jgi:hypothetical protein
VCVCSRLILCNNQLVPPEAVACWLVVGRDYGIVWVMCCGEELSLICYLGSVAMGVIPPGGVVVPWLSSFIKCW